MVEAAIAPPRGTPDRTPTAATKSSASNAVVAKPGLRLQKIGDFSSPVYVTSPRGDRHRIFVVEQGGTIRIVKDGKKLAQPFLNIASRISTGGERGLLSMAFAPDYGKSGRFYVYYTAKNGDIRIVEFRRKSANRANPGSGRRLLSVTHTADNHNGGLRAVRAGQAPVRRPRRRRWRRATSTGRAATARTCTRCSARSSASAIRGPSTRSAQIYAYGLRNPWRYTFAPSGNMIIADVGQDTVEEVDVINKKGSNLGWRVWEGRRRYSPGETAPNAIFPVIQRFHSDGNCSITGGVVVRDPVLSALKGPLRVRRLLLRHRRVRPHQRPEGAGRAQHGTEGRFAVVVRRRRAQARVRDLAERPCVSARPR